MINGATFGLGLFIGIVFTMIMIDLTCHMFTGRLLTGCGFLIGAIGGFCAVVILYLSVAGS